MAAPPTHAARRRQPSIIPPRQQQQPPLLGARITGSSDTLISPLAAGPTTSMG